MIGLAPLRGHEAVRQDLGRAVAGGELPGSILLHGPRGIGKQRLGLWLAQRLLCRAAAGTEPCGTCPDCRIALRLEHPDLHWFFPLARPKGASGGVEKLAGALEEARHVELGARREDPFRTARPGEPVGYYLATIHTLRRNASARPAMGSRAVFLIGDAELLVPQESSPEAANALLKLIEEPPPAAVFVLTASDPDALLPTIRSRLLGVRMRPLPDAEVARFLVEERAAEPARAGTVARIAQGAIGRALGFLPDDGAPGPLEEIRQQARAMLGAAAASTPAARFAAAHATAPAAARGAFSDVLESLLLWLRDLAAVATGSEAALINADAHDDLADLARRLPGAGTDVPAAVDAVDEALALARGNVNPQLLTASMLGRIHRALAGAP